MLFKRPLKPPSPPTPPSQAPTERIPLLDGAILQAAFILLILLALVFLESCTPVPVEIKNLTIYGSLGTEGAAVVQTLSTATSQISNAEWQTIWMNPGLAPGPMVCMSSSDFAELKYELEAVCSFYGHCTDEAVASASAAYSRVKAALKQGSGGSLAPR